MGSVASYYLLLGGCVVLVKKELCLDSKELRFMEMRRSSKWEKCVTQK